MTEIRSISERSNYITNQLAAMALPPALGTAFVVTPHSTASFNTASFRTTGAVGSPKVFSTLAVGPGLNNLSVKDDYVSYQWALRNNGQVQRIERKLDIKIVDPIINMDENGVDNVSLSPLGPGNFKALTTDAAKGIDINIQPAQGLYDQLEAERLVVVAVIDTGIDTTHPDLKDSMQVNEDEIPGDGIDNDGNGYIDDVNGWNFLDNINQLYVGREDSHGTHAADTIVASRGNGGIAGINDGQYVKIMSLGALGGESGKGSPEGVIVAIRCAEANGAQICSPSFGFENYTKESMAVMQNPKTLFVVAAGNGDESEKGYSIDQCPIYPVNLPFDNVITVANLMFDGKLDRSSNHGPVNVDLAAPGCFILDTISDRSYTFMTSAPMAVPMATGVAAMVHSARPDLDLIGVKNVLLASVKKLDTLNGRVPSGGMLGVYSALQWGRSQ